jgi:2-isopropylmalate synthase
VWMRPVNTVPFPPVRLPDRQWPSRILTQAPRWCSVDLRDGNQALIEPMDGERKRRFFDLLVRMGFKEIEVGVSVRLADRFRFRAQPDRRRPDPGRCRDAGADAVARGFDPPHLRQLRGAKRAIPHLYNATAPIFREVVFGLDRPA